MIFTVSTLSDNKYLYEFQTDNKQYKIAEAIGQWMNDKYIISVSVMNSCFVGCKNCPYQDYNLVNHRNLTVDEITNQVYTILEHQKIIKDSKDVKNIDWLEIIFGVTIGEPFMNWDAVKNSMIQLHNVFPRIHFTIRTIAPNFQKPYLELVELYKTIPNITLQFIINSTEILQKSNISFKSKMSLTHIRDIATGFYVYTHNRSQLYYTVTEQDSKTTAEDLKNLFSPIVFSLILTTQQDNQYVNNFEQYFNNEGYEIIKLY